MKARLPAAGPGPAPPARIALSPQAGRRLGIAVRVVAAVPGGYAVAALATMLLSVTLPLARAEAVLAASMASFAIFTAAVVWAFAARSAPRACAGLAAAAALLGLALLLQGAGA